MREPYEHLLQALQESELRRLHKCLEEIDHKLLDCRERVEEYHRTRLALQSINEKLSLLGAQPLSVAGEEVSGQDLAEIINSRIQRFKSSGKL
ncbi:MAG TPA: hypothetical protein VNN77_10175 [candidate division Zixibacteria bacterium]|nr:hypothetical protein [candidate division Zixibacteria bacterium]